MVPKLARLCVLALTLTLAACFRPAGEPIEPTPNTNPPAPTREMVDETAETDEAALSPVDAGTEEASADDASETMPSFGALNQLGGTLPPITVIQPTRNIAVTQAPFDVNATALPGASPTYITPGVPLGPIPRTATPTGGALTSTPSGLVTPTAMAGMSSDGCTYSVQPGDSLFRIATNHNVTLAEMRAANPDLVGEAPILQPGQELNLPNCGQPAPADQSAAAPEPTTGAEAPPGSEIYTVRSGDTLMIIAQRYGITINDIVQANNLSNPDRLDVGQQLIIPPAGG